MISISKNPVHLYHLLHEFSDVCSHITFAAKSDCGKHGKKSNDFILLFERGTECLVYGLNEQWHANVSLVDWTDEIKMGVEGPKSITK